MPFSSSAEDTAELVRQVLVPFLLVCGALLGALLAFLILQRALRTLAERRRQALTVQYQPLIDAIGESGVTREAFERLRQIPLTHRRVMAHLVLAPLHVARSERLAAHMREAAVAIGLVEQWYANLQSRHWWQRADSVRALGFIEEQPALPAILNALADEHEEVRAAAIDAAGRLGDPGAIPALLERLVDGSRGQHARVVDALRNLGPSVTPALVDLVREQPQHTRAAADVLGLIGTAAATDPLLLWCGDPRAEVRAAALAALGSIGLDERSHYFALRALGDTDPQARAMAARALGRGQREDAVGYLAARLNDEWLPAAHAAEALRRLGEPGLAVLQSHADDADQAGDLARQALWSPAAVVNR